MRNGRTTQTQLVRFVDPGLDEQLAVIANLHLAVSERRVVADDAHQIAERIDIEQRKLAAVEVLVAAGKLRHRPHPGRRPQMTGRIGEHAVIVKRRQDRRRGRDDRRLLLFELADIGAVFERLMLHQRGAADEPRHETEPQPDRAAQWIGIENNVIGLK